MNDKCTLFKNQENSEYKMNKKINNKKLIKIMTQYNLSVKDVSSILKVGKNRVYSWCTNSKWKRNMPDHLLYLLTISLKGKISE